MTSFLGRARASTAAVAASLLVAGVALAESSIGSLARVMGVRDNQLVGYGLVIGLDGTGDRSGSTFTEHSMSSLLEELGITLSPQDLRLRNVAAVLVTCDLPPFAREGSRVDVLVSSIGSAKNLRGGVLVQTPLRGADGNVYIVAQGPVSLGGFAADAPGGSRVKKNHLTVARIPNGGIVEREVPFDIFEGGSMDVVLNRADFRTATRVARAIDAAFGAGTATARDPGTVTIPIARIPAALGPIGFAARIEELSVEPGRPARVVINERTGTIVAGGDVKVAAVAISHGGLTIEVNSNPAVSQPPSFSSSGETVIVPHSDLSVREDGSIVAVAATTTISELAQALNALGVGSSDVIAIFQALSEAHALDAELVVI